MTATVSTSKYRVIVDNVSAMSPVVQEIKKIVASAEWDNGLKVLYTALADETTVRVIVSKYAAPVAKPATQSTERIKVRAEKVAVGDVINGKKVVSLGKSWTQFVADEDTSVWGLQPGQSYNINVCYAYFN